MSGKFEIRSGNCQGNVREFCFRWSVATKRKAVLNEHLRSSTDSCYIQNRAITYCVIKRLRCISHEEAYLYFQFGEVFAQ